MHSVNIALEEVRSAKNQGTPLDRIFIEKVSAKIHEAWVRRNQTDVNPALEKMYFELSEEEKEKDRYFVREAISLLE